MRNFLIYVGLMVGLFAYAVLVSCIIQIAIEKQKDHERRLNRPEIVRPL